MIIKRPWLFIQSIPIVLGASLVTAPMVCAAEQIDAQAQTLAPEPIVAESSGTGTVSLHENPVERDAVEEGDSAIAHTP